MVFYLAAFSFCHLLLRNINSTFSKADGLNLMLHSIHITIGKGRKRESMEQAQEACILNLVLQYIISRETAQFM